MSGSDDKQQTYRDFVDITEEDATAMFQESRPETSSTRINFPVQLHYMLSEMEKDGNQHIATWRQHGRCFRVMDKKTLQEEHLPLWYQQNHFASFLRQLNTYGFRRIPSGRDKGSYFHAMFLRNKPFLAKYIPRSRRTRSMQREPVPDFYSMESAYGPAAPGGVASATATASNTRQEASSNIILGQSGIPALAGAQMSGRNPDPASVMASMQAQQDPRINLASSMPSSLLIGSVFQQGQQHQPQAQQGLPGHALNAAALLNSTQSLTSLAMLQQNFPAATLHQQFPSLPVQDFGGTLQRALAIQQQQAHALQLERAVSFNTGTVPSVSALDPLSRVFLYPESTMSTSQQQLQLSTRDSVSDASDRAGCSNPTSPTSPEHSQGGR